MKSIASLSWLGSIVLAFAPAAAADRIPWVADYRTACAMAADQHRLVLLHFYNDNCGPCVRLEQNVFSRADVGEAVAQSYLPVKVHAGKNPELARRYQINAWPTDVYVTPSGLEVHRTISPQNPAEYVAVLNRIAQQTGTGAAHVRTAPPRQPPQASASGIALAANQSAVDVAAAQQAAAGEAQSVSSQAQQQWGAAVQQFASASNQARATLEQSAQQATAAAEQARQEAAMLAQQAEQRAAGVAERTSAAAGQWTQQAASAVDRAQQQAGDAYRQVREQAGQTAQQVERRAEQTAEQWRATAQQTVQQTTEQLGTAAQSVAAPWQQMAGQSPFNRRSSFIPNASSAAETSPAPAPPAQSSPAPQVAPAPHVVASREVPALPRQPAPPPLMPSQTALPQQQPQQPVVTSFQPPPPTENPWVTARNLPAPQQPQPQPQPQIARVSPMAAPPPAPPASAASERQLIPASQAPPIALDGFCPVTLIETMGKAPGDRAAWKKGNVNFGAIHQGRTYLFASAEQQQKFLAHPDSYAPVLSGYDPVCFAERGELLDGKRAYGLVTPDKRIFLFAEETSLQKFCQAPTRYTAAVQQAMAAAANATGNVYR